MSSIHTKRRSRLSRRSALGAVLVSGALIFAACGSDDSSGSEDSDDSSSDATTAGSDVETTDSDSTDDADTTDAAGDPVQGGILRVAHTSTPSRLDPQLATSGFDHYVLYPMFDRLINFDPASMEPLPGLAKAWSYPDPQTLVLELQEGVTFQDGTPFNADAVVFNIERGKTHEESAISADLESVDSAEAIDDLTVQLNLNRPDTALVLMLSDKAGMMVSPTAVEASGEDFLNHPVGAGPFAFESYVPGETLVLTAYDGYYKEGQPYLDGMVFTIYEDSRTAVNALVSGQEDFATTIDSPDLDRVESADGVELVITNTLAFNRCYLRLGEEPFDNVQVRQALNFGIDRDAINLVINQGQGESAQALFPSDNWAYPTDNVPVYDYDPEHAKELLAEAGYPDGITFDLIVVNDPRDRSMVEVMQAQLEPAGISLEVTVLDIAEASPAFREQGEGDLYCVGWSGRPDPYGTFQAIYDPESVYVTEYTPPEGMDELLAESIAVEDQDERAEIFAELHQMLTVENALDFAVAMRPGIQAHADAVEGYVPNAYGKPIMNDVWLTSG